VGVTRKCTKCLSLKDVNDFYSKGNRIASECKQCKKSIKKAKYVAKASHSQCASVNKVIDVFCELQNVQYENYLQKLKQIIEQSSSRKENYYV
jgi:hypothetical protein